MNRLALFAVTGVLALMLTACGEDKDTAKPAEAKPDVTVNVQQGTDKADDTSKTATPDESNKATEDKSN